VSWVDHPLHCSCVECVARDPRYAGRRGTSRSLIERLSRRGVSFRLVGGKVIQRVKDEVYQLLREDDERWRRGKGNVRDEGRAFELLRELKGEKGAA
jgi:hypothetical protein